MKNSAKFVAVNAIVAGLYVVFTMPFAVVTSGAMQLRLAEALTVLPALFPYTAVGVTVGCAVSNVLSPFGLWDIIAGSLTTLVAATLSATICKKKWLAPLPPIVLNAVLLPLVWLFTGSVDGIYYVLVLWMLLSQSVVCYGLGVPLYVFADKRLRPLLELN